MPFDYYTTENGTVHFVTDFDRAHRLVETGCGHTFQDAHAVTKARDLSSVDIPDDGKKCRRCRWY